MKRASYRHAIEWIALNDSNGDDDRLNPDRTAFYVTSLLVADLFDVPEERVGRDIVRKRKQFDKEEQA